MVLIRDRGLLAPRRTSEHHPGPRDGRRPEPFYGELDEALAQRVDDERDHPSDIDRVRPFIDEARHDPRQIQTRRCDPREVRGGFDARAELEGRAPSESHQVHVRNHAEESASRVHDRDVPNARLQHRQEDVRGPANAARFVFLDTRATEFYVEWERVAHDVVALLRAEAGCDPYDSALSDLIGELSTRSEEFRVRWAAHDVRLHRTGVKRFHHPLVGDLTLSYEALELPADPGLTIFAYTAEPNSRHTTRSTSSPAGPRRLTTRSPRCRPRRRSELRATLQPEIDHNDATLGVQPGQLLAARSK